MASGEHDDEDWVERGFELWRRAMRWQRAVNRALKPLGLTHTQFMLMDAVDRRECEVDGAIMQRHAAEAAGLDPGTTSAVMKRLADRGLVDRDVSGGEDERPWRILLGTHGRVTLAAAWPLVQEAADEFFRRDQSNRRS